MDIHALQVVLRDYNDELVLAENQRERLEQQVVETRHRVSELQTVITSLKQRLASAPSNSPLRPLHEVIEGLLRDEPYLTKDAIFDRVAPRYFPQGLDSNAQRSVSMYISHARKRLDARESEKAEPLFDSGSKSG